MIEVSALEYRYSSVPRVLSSYPDRDMLKYVLFILEFLIKSKSQATFLRKRGFSVNNAIVPLRNALQVIGLTFSKHTGVMAIKKIYR